MLVHAREAPGRGRGIFAAQQISAGDVVLREPPVLLYPQHGTAAAFCSHCLRAFNSLEENAAAVVACSTCGLVGFCGPPCAAAAAVDPGSHCPAVCRLLSACNLSGLTDEQQTALQFLFRCCSLRAAAAAGDAAAAARLTTITSLQAPPALPSLEAAADGSSSGSNHGGWSAGSTEVRELHGRLSHALAAAGAGPAAALSLEEVAELLRRDAANGYGIMAPSAPDGERRIRGTGLYALPSLINHECLPNVARFDRFDRPPGEDPAPAANAAVEFRALHDIPQEEEITQSYFPLPWPLGERQQRCREDYGFECTCPRCKEEATWSEEESEWETDDDAGMEDAEAAGGGAGGSACAHAHADGAQQQGQQGAAGPAAAGQEGQQQQQADPAYINLFLLKYVCPREGCYGTLAPLPGQPAGRPGGPLFECNMCGGRRSEAEFLAELEAAD
ncbi:hypothetical protein ABPG77_006156 [Micractinium sp. CCAP 211/92]